MIYCRPSKIAGMYLFVFGQRTSQNIGVIEKYQVIDVPRLSYSHCNTVIQIVVKLSCQYLNPGQNENK